MTTPSPEFFALQRAVAGRYSLEREIGRGGMGVVFLARDVALDRPVAIKLLPPPLAAQPAARARFLREARTAARLSHPNIVPIHAVEETDDLAYYVMAFVDGETLGERVRRAGPLPAADALRVTQEVAWALAHAHAHGVVHRDVKPDNVLLERGSGRALVTDFGIARAGEGGTPADGTPVGTPAYMSPEQGAGEPAEARSDLYSLGVTAFYAASGRLPFEAPNALAMLARHAAEPPPPLLGARPSLPPAFARAVDRCLAKDRAARWATAEAFASALDAVRGALPAVPAPVRAFVAESDATGTQLGTALLVVVVALTWGAFVHDFLGITQAVMFVGAALTLGLAVGRLVRLVRRAGALLRLGYGPDAVRWALALAAREDAAEVPEQPAEAVRARRWRTAGLVAAAGGLTPLLYWLSNGAGGRFDVPIWLGAIIVVLTIVLPAFALQRLWAEVRAGRPSMWRELLLGGADRALFAAARLGAGGQAPMQPVAGEPTVVALGRAAGDLFAALPPADRARLDDVPALLGRLQADALALKARDDPAAAERHATAVAALETVRLDLLRLHAGAGSLDELTRDVEAARDIGARIDAELAARADVRRLAETTTPV